MLISKSFIQDLLNRLDIVTVVERYVPLKKAGANFSACCPFHSESTPSFTVSPSKQFYHCFGCGAHGTAISFVMEHTGLSYVDSIESLAGMAGLEVRYERTEAGAVNKPVALDLYKVIQAAVEYYQAQLKYSKLASGYLEKRGLNSEVIEKFSLGYAPDAWQGLSKAFTNYDDELLNDAGLVTGDKGKRYDRFRDRIMFPIINSRGQPIAFGGRILEKEGPKYLNSPETTLFEKGHELYGLFQAQKHIRAQRRVLVVEGYMDVVALVQHGVEYAVATLGTATTPIHIQKLLRLTPNIVFCFDGDKAGQKAAWRALENSLPLLKDGMALSFLFLPVEHDPDSYIRQFGKDNFEKCVKEATPLSEYLMQEIKAGFDLRTAEGRNQMILHAKPLITAIVSPAMAVFMRKAVAAIAELTLEEFEAVSDLKSVVTQKRKLGQKVAGATSLSLQRTMLRCLIAQPELAKKIELDKCGTGLEAEVIAAILPIIRGTNFMMSSAALMEHVKGGPYEKLFAEQQTGLMDWDDKVEIETTFLEAYNKIQSKENPLQRQALENKWSSGSILGLSEEEREEYRQLVRRN